MPQTTVPQRGGGRHREETETGEGRTVGGDTEDLVHTGESNPVVGSGRLVESN